MDVANQSWLLIKNKSARLTRLHKEAWIGFACDALCI